MANRVKEVSVDNQEPPVTVEPTGSRVSGVYPDVKDRPDLLDPKETAERTDSQDHPVTTAALDSLDLLVS